jgi:hypothetical protein
LEGQQVSFWKQMPGHSFFAALRVPFEKSNKCPKRKEGKRKEGKRKEGKRKEGKRKEGKRKEKKRKEKKTKQNKTKQNKTKKSQAQHSGYDGGGGGAPPSCGVAAAFLRLPRCNILLMLCLSSSHTKKVPLLK